MKINLPPVSPEPTKPTALTVIKVRSAIRHGVDAPTMWGEDA